MHVSYHSMMGLEVETPTVLADGSAAPVQSSGILHWDVSWCRFTGFA